ncbi:hypothetical protein CISG_09823 [Coccidioides immitis RMSCC 3703]|uniref:Exportin-5 C-terminal domain-containing protein n=1 Tax=Coccidioides immitis RMSCC 3703 TaxID=454286 RepID=A0A0J8QN56_COCIT|nr:hypothetical protein CISG_09823 [Coccidioides immitis RMSCC 3703]
MSIRIYDKPAWANDQFRQIISTFQGFCEVFALDQVHPYLQARQAQNIEDWSVITLDEEGKRIQSQMNSKFQSVPLRNTKTLLAVSTEKLKPSDPPYQVSCELWKDMIPLILPSLLQLVGLVTLIPRCLIDDCPPQSRGHFLPPMMSSLFVQLDKKITTEWDVIERRRAGMVDDDLTEEMKEESILRQLTYSAVIMVASLLDPNKEGLLL